MSPTLAPINPKAVSQRGLEIYREKYQAEYESKHQSQFVAIDIRTGAATLGESADEALDKASTANPQGMFHLVRIGFRAAFRFLNPVH